MGGNSARGGGRQSYVYPGGKDAKQEVRQVGQQAVLSHTPRKKSPQQRGQGQR